MFKNIVFVIIFVAIYGFIGYCFATKPDNNISDCGSGGTVANSVYENTECGFSINLDEDWVYFAPEAADKDKAAEYGVNINDIPDGTVLLGLAKPDKSIVCAKMDEEFTAKELSLDYLHELAYSNAIDHEEIGCKVYDYGAGLMDNDEVFYYYVDYDKLGKMRILFNTDNKTSVQIYCYYPIGQRDSFISFFENNLKVNKD